MKKIVIASMMMSALLLWASGVFALPAQDECGVKSTCPNLVVPPFGGITSEITFSGTNGVVTPGFNMDLNLSHSCPGCVFMKLESPSGTVVRLWCGAGGEFVDIVGNFPNTLPVCDDGFFWFWGEPLDGTWTLTIADSGSGQGGTLNCWGINDPGACSGECSDKGDINVDGKIDIADAYLLRRMMGKKRGQAGYKVAGDMDDSGKIEALDYSDLLELIRYEIPPCPQKD